MATSRRHLLSVHLCSGLSFDSDHLSAFHSSVLKQISISKQGGPDRQRGKLCGCQPSKVSFFRDASKSHERNVATGGVRRGRRELSKARCRGAGESETLQVIERSESAIGNRLPPGGAMFRTENGEKEKESANWQNVCRNNAATLACHDGLMRDLS